MRWPIGCAGVFPAGVLKLFAVRMNTQDHSADEVSAISKVLGMKVKQQIIYACPQGKLQPNLLTVRERPYFLNYITNSTP